MNRKPTREEVLGIAQAYREGLEREIGPATDTRIEYNRDTGAYYIEVQGKVKRPQAIAVMSEFLDLNGGEGIE